MTIEHPRPDEGQEYERRMDDIEATLRRLTTAVTGAGAVLDINRWPDLPKDDDTPGRSRTDSVCEWVVFPNTTDPPMTKEEMLAWAPRAVAERHTRKLDGVVEDARNLLGAFLSVIEKRRDQFVVVACPCCSIELNASTTEDEYVTDLIDHILHPPQGCDRRRWATLIPLDQIDEGDLLDDDNQPLERVILPATG